jgi:hypothetical protein
MEAGELLASQAAPRPLAERRRKSLLSMDTSLCELGYACSYRLFFLPDDFFAGSSGGDDE